MCITWCYFILVWERKEIEALFIVCIDARLEHSFKCSETLWEPRMFHVFTNVKISYISIILCHYFLAIFPDVISVPLCPLGHWFLTFCSWCTHWPQCKALHTPFVMVTFFMRKIFYFYTDKSCQNNITLSKLCMPNQFSA